jgi:hypothetical protein
MNPTIQTDLGTLESPLDETVNIKKVTAVQVAPAVHRSKWQHQFEKRAKEQGKILETT